MRSLRRKLALSSLVWVLRTDLKSIRRTKPAPMREGCAMSVRGHPAASWEARVGRVGSKILLRGSEIRPVLATLERGVVRVLRLSRRSTGSSGGQSGQQVGRSTGSSGGRGKVGLSHGGKTGGGGGGIGCGGGSGRVEVGKSWRRAVKVTERKRHGVGG